MKFFFHGKLYLVTNISPTLRTILYIFVVALIFESVILAKHVYVVIVWNCFVALHAAVTPFNFIFVEYLLKGVDSGEMNIY